MHLCMQIWAVNEFEGVTDFTSKVCMLHKAFYRDRLINSDSVAFGVRGNLSGLRVRELKRWESTVHRQKLGLQPSINPTEKH